MGIPQHLQRGRIGTGNKSLEVEGKLDKLSGKIQSGQGDAKEKLKDIIDKV